MSGVVAQRLYTEDDLEAELERRILALTRDTDWVTNSRLGPVAQEYLAWKRLAAAPRTIDTYERRLAVLCRAVPHATIESLDVTDVMLALQPIPVRSHAPTIAAWNGMVEWAILFDKRGAKNPINLLPKRKRYAPPAVRLFTEVERSRIIAAAELGLDPARDRVRAYLLLDGGFRKGECRELRNRDVDPMRREVIVTGKGSKERVVQIETEAFWIAWLDHMVTAYPKMERTPEPDDFLWFPMRVAGAYGARERQVTRCYPEKPIVESGWHRWWYDLLGRAGIVKAGVTSGRKAHTTRHTYATDALDATDDLYGVKELLGHSSTRVTEGYLHSSEKHKRTVAEKLARSRESDPSDSSKVVR